jgi:hypothetical protein
MYAVLDVLDVAAGRRRHVEHGIVGGTVAARPERQDLLNRRRFAAHVGVEKLQQRSIERVRRL